MATAKPWRFWVYTTLSKDGGLTWSAVRGAPKFLLTPMVAFAAIVALVVLLRSPGKPDATASAPAPVASTAPTVAAIAPDETAAARVKRFEGLLSLVDSDEARQTRAARSNTRSPGAL